MLLKIKSACVMGIQAQLIDVEVDSSPAMRGYYNVVGLPDTAIRESSERVRAAMRNCSYRFPNKEAITVNLSPADFKKEGSCYDLPIALALLGVTEALPAECFEGWLVMGELSLDGRVRPVRGALPVALSAQKAGVRRMLLPDENCEEAAVVEGLEVFRASALRQVCRLLVDGDGAPVRVCRRQLLDAAGRETADFRDVKGQQSAKRALEVATAGGHNILMIGPPGAGKTMLAKRLPSILPSMTFAEALETTAIHSVAGHLRSGRSFLVRRPFRAPHHTISTAGLVGGGRNPRPGEVSLAHNGVLFLDELPEFQRHVLEVLRQPLEDGEVTISRAVRTLTFPSSFMLAAALNPCPCGYAGSSQKECMCTQMQIQRYMAKMSGPLLDRIDLHIDVAEVAYKELGKAPDGEPSEAVARRVRSARARQLKRFEGTRIFCNALMGPREIQEHCRVNDPTARMLEEAAQRFGFSARTYDRILKVARTIADISDSEAIDDACVAEAIQYRRLDRDRWE